MNPLLSDVDKVLKSVAGSTAAIDFPGLVPWLNLHLAASGGRSEAAPDRSRDRSERIRGAVQWAIAALPLLEADVVLLKIIKDRLRPKLVERHLSRVPGDRLILDEVRKSRRSRTGMTSARP